MSISHLWGELIGTHDLSLSLSTIYLTTALIVALSVSRE